MIRLVVATGNRGKLRELEALVPAGFDLQTLTDAGLESVEETGSNFAENASLKAVAAASAANQLALADDSGLEVDALGGAPGVYSARYAGEPPDDDANIAKLLDAMQSVPLAQRTARFHCVVALASPDGVIATADGRCEGAIGYTPRGEHGFGYDPVFVFPDGRTMAELPADVKNQISHRANAIRALRPALERLAGEVVGGGVG
jgi:XTP/dITP diphosphohydrolase